MAATSIHSDDLFLLIAAMPASLQWRLQALTCDDLDVERRVVRVAEAPQPSHTFEPSKAAGRFVHYVKKNSTAQTSHLLREVFSLYAGLEEGAARESLREAEEGVQRTLHEGVVVELAPPRSWVRRLQHKLGYATGWWRSASAASRNGIW